MQRVLKQLQLIKIMYNKLNGGGGVVSRKKEISTVETRPTLDLIHFH